MEDYTDEQIAEVIDAFGQRADVEAVALQKGIPPSVVRKMLDSPEIARAALNRKRNEMAFWFAGRVMDELRDMILASEGVAPQTKLGAIRLLRDILGSEESQKSEAVAELAEVISIEEAIDQSSR